MRAITFQAYTLDISGEWRSFTTAQVVVRGHTSSTTLQRCTTHKRKASQRTNHLLQNQQTACASTLLSAGECGPSTGDDPLFSTHADPPVCGFDIATFTTYPVSSAAQV